MQRPPSSPSRSQALVEFEPVLLKTFQGLTQNVNREVRDAMHYALFSVKDRFCASSAWLIAPRLDIAASKLERPIAAIETIRCALLFKTKNHKALEPALTEAAAYGLIPLAFEMLVTPATSSLNDAEQTAAVRILAQAASPVHVLSAIHKESHVLREGIRSKNELLDLISEKVTPAFNATGEILRLFAEPSESLNRLPQWFQKLGLFAHMLDEFVSPPTASSQNVISLRHYMTVPETLDVIKSLETELLDSARAMELQGAAHEIIEPLADLLKTRLQ